MFWLAIIDVARGLRMDRQKSKTKTPHYVKNFLRHKELRNTEIYINIEHALFDKYDDVFTVKVVDKPEEIKALIEVGFEYVCQKDNLIFMRKRK